MDVLKVNYDKILKDAYDEHGSLIVAFDFDNTVFDFHKKGLDFSRIVNLLIDCERLGFKLICFTSNEGDRLTFIKYYIREVLQIDTQVAMNADWDFKSGNPKHATVIKPYANIYLDDKAGLNESYTRLKNLVDSIKKTNKIK